MSRQLQFDAHWRRPAYALPIAICSALMLLSAGRRLLELAGLVVHRTGLFSGAWPLATVVLLYFLLLEIPGRKLILGANAITLKSWFGTRSLAWADIKDVQPGAGGWLAVNRQLPVAARLVVRGTADTIPVPDVFRARRQDVFNQVRNHWLAARKAAAKRHPGRRDDEPDASV